MSDIRTSEVTESVRARWRGIYCLPADLRCVSLPALVVGGHRRWALLAGDGVVTASMSTIAIMRCRTREELTRECLSASEMALGIGWDADGREVMA